MAGIRIHHPTLRSCKLLVPHPGDDKRLPKDYHIVLDEEGDCIVSETVWERLQQARQSGLSPHDFIVLNTVETPPHIVVGEVPARQVRTYRQTPDGVTDAQMLSAIQQFAPPGVTPRIINRKEP